MKLSFVIPAYNEEVLIGNCLDSIIEQAGDYQDDIEIIVVNNASTDRTRETAMSRGRVIVVDEPKKGIVHARQAGFLASTGGLIANIDADSILTPGWVDKVMKEFSQNQALAALSGPCIFYDLSEGYNVLVRVYYYAWFLTHIINQYVFHTDAMLQGGNFVLRRSALQKIGGFDTSIAFYGEDADIARRIQKIGWVKFDFKLPVYSSGRRLKKEGFIITAWRYFINYLWILIFGRPFSKNYKDIRSESLP
jgi:glycosyltransferase involved in cell wall biosynthesis